MPTDDSRNTFCLQRSTPIVLAVAGNGVVAAAVAAPPMLPVRSISAPAFAPLPRPVTFSPARIGTSLPFSSPHAPTEEWPHVVTGAGAEIADVRALQEEGALLGKDDGKSREVRTSRVQRMAVGTIHATRIQQ